MSNRTIKDGITMVSGFHFFMALLSLIGTAAILVYAVMPSLKTQTPEFAQQLFLPMTGVVFGIIIFGAYIYIGIGLIQLKDWSRMAAIFLGILGIMGGFIGVIGATATSLTGSTVPDWMSATMIGLLMMCAYSLLSFVDIFILIFLFNPLVRDVYDTGRLILMTEEEYGSKGADS